MNSITHAYSVVAFLLIAGCTLIGFPMSVFSQSTVPASSTETVLEEESTVIDELPVLEATITPEISVDLSDTLTDSYPREKLIGGEVFNDFVVGPGKFTLEIAPGESKVVEMVISNRMGVRKRFSFSTEDAAGSADGSEAIVLLGDAKGPYTLRDYIKIPDMQFDLNHSERVRVPVTVSLPADAEPGGYYGSLIVSIVSDAVDLDEEGGAKPGSVVISRIGTLFFVTTPGEIKHDGKLQKFSTVGNQWIYANGLIPFALVSENFGSVHLTPYGEVRIYNMLGNEVGFVEMQPWFVMPKSLRTREVSWNREFLMGRYTAVAKINRGYEDIVDEQSYSFWIIPWKLIVPVFAGLFVFFLLLRFIFSQFEFKRKSD